ncbi:MAG: AraC family transcriptional regulator [Hyphomicrobiales bacterium]|nr:AraC family transcriptional regulator [Hyphomicrobiales bacterium]MCP4999768.1 AraC family transcriptional regulator [Hyphomicrobiales bacterium]
MLSRPEGELDYSVLCSKLGCSERAIQLAFARREDMSPTRYLRTIRLNQVRRMLLSASLSDQSIGDLAARGGFWNWSRFSQSYKDQFGELPSETRRRVQ